MVNLTDLFKSKADTPTTKPQLPQRDARGHFISTKKKPQPTAEKQIDSQAKITPETTQTETSSATFTTSTDTPPLTFYGHTIHRHQQDSQWFFHLTDLIATANIVNPESYTDKLVHSKDFTPSTAIIINGNHFVSPDTFISLLPALRTLDLSFPGPLPEWLKESSTINQQ